MEKVAAVKCPTYEPEKVYEAIKEALRRLEFVVPEDKTVLLKPNILSQNNGASALYIFQGHVVSGQNSAYPPACTKAQTESPSLNEVSFASTILPATSKPGISLAPAGAG